MKQIRFYLAFILWAIVNNTFAQPGSNPAGDAWFQQASAEISDMEYSFRPQPASHQVYTAVNAANRLRFAEIHAQGYVVYAAAPSGKRLAAFSLQTIAGMEVKDRSGADFVIVKDNRSLVFRSSSYDVEYINAPDGMRQNFIIRQEPTGEKALTVEINIQSELKARMETDNRIVLGGLQTNKDIQLVYDGLKVFDAEGKLLPASMRLDETGTNLTIEADDNNAVYPVTIDPLNRTPEWTTSADGILPGLLTSLQLQVQTLYGYTVAGLGDINGDGYDDVAVSAPGMADVITGTGSLTGVGAVFIYLGSPTGLPTTPSKVLQPTTAVDGALFGYSVDAGDITGDGKNDIIIGAPLDRYQTMARGLLGPVNVEVTAGKVYMYRSEDLFSAPNPSPFLQIRLQGQAYFSNILSGLFQSNIDVNALFGFAVCVTRDLNGDNKSDIIIGSPSYLGVDILSVQSGAAFVYYSDDLSTTSPAELNAPTPTLLGLPLLPLANTTGLLFGFSVDGAGDFNNDGFPDLVAGAPAGIDLSSLGGIFTGQFLGGSAYIYYGNGSGVSSTISVRLQAEPTGLLSNAANLFGYEVKGAANAAGLKTGHVLVGAPDGAVLSNVLNGLRLKAGQVHVFKKKPGASGNYTSDQVISSPRSSSLLSILAGQTIRVSALFGASIDNMLDVNCDNIGDIIVGEPMSTAVPLIGANVVGGAAYVYLGNADGTYQAAPFWDLGVTVSPLLGVNATSLLGYSVAGAGHVRGSTQGVRSLVGGPSNSLDFGAGLLNLGNTIGVLFDFVFDDNGLGKAYSFPFSSCNITLPVTLIDFRGQKQGNAAALNWASVAEYDLAWYELQRSRDGIHFETIALVAAQNLQHNDYSFTDTRMNNGMNYYRLKMIDTDNSFSYSTIVSVNFSNKNNLNILVAPNPATDQVTLQLSGLTKGVYRAELVNAAGQLVMRKMINIVQADQHEIFIRDASVGNGIYTLSLYDSDNKRAASARVLFAGR